MFTVSLSLVIYRQVWWANPLIITPVVQDLLKLIVEEWSTFVPKVWTHLIISSFWLSLKFMDRFFGSMPISYLKKKKSDSPPFPPSLKILNYIHVWCLWSINRAKKYYFCCSNLSPPPLEITPPTPDFPLSRKPLKHRLSGCLWSI